MAVVKKLGWFVLGLGCWLIWLLIIAVAIDFFITSDPFAGGSPAGSLTVILVAIAYILSILPYARSIIKEDGSTHWTRPFGTAWLAVIVIAVCYLITR